MRKNEDWRILLKLRIVERRGLDYGTRWWIIKIKI